MHCKTVLNFTVSHDHAFKSCQTRWPLISLRNLILIDQLRMWCKQTKEFFHTLAAVNDLNTERYVIQRKNANKSTKLCALSDVSSYTECITIVRFDVIYMLRSLWICYNDVNSHTLNIQSIKTPPIGHMGFKMILPISCILQLQ